MNEKNDPNASWPHPADCMCRKCCNPQRLPTIEELESTLHEEKSFERRATAYAALTLTRILASEWIHVMRKQDGSYESIAKPAGEIVGDRAGLERRLERFAWELR